MIYTPLKLATRPNLDLLWTPHQKPWVRGLPQIAQDALENLTSLDQVWLQLQTTMLAPANQDARIQTILHTLATKFATWVSLDDPRGQQWIDGLAKIRQTILDDAPGHKLFPLRANNQSMYMTANLHIHNHNGINTQASRRVHTSLNWHISQSTDASAVDYTAPVWPTKFKEQCLVQNESPGLIWKLTLLLILTNEPETTAIWQQWRDILNPNINTNVFEIVNLTAVTEDLDVTMGLLRTITLTVAAPALSEPPDKHKVRKSLLAAGGHLNFSPLPKLAQQQWSVADKFFARSVEINPNISAEDYRQSLGTFILGHAAQIAFHDQHQSPPIVWPKTPMDYNHLEPLLALYQYDILTPTQREVKVEESLQTNLRGHFIARGCQVAKLFARYNDHADFRQVHQLLEAETLTLAQAALGAQAPFEHFCLLEAQKNLLGIKAVLEWGWAKEVETIRLNSSETGRILFPDLSRESRLPINALTLSALSVVVFRLGSKLRIHANQPDFSLASTGLTAHYAGEPPNIILAKAERVLPLIFPDKDHLTPIDYSLILARGLSVLIKDLPVSEPSKNLSFLESSQAYLNHPDVSETTRGQLMHVFLRNQQQSTKPSPGNGEPGTRTAAKKLRI